MTIEQEHLDHEDRRLVDLLNSVLVDPDLHTDTRMRLHHEISEILRSAHHDVYGHAGHEVHRRAVEAHGARLHDLLATVLVDPNLHTDTRLRLHHEIAEILDSAHARQRV